MKLLAFLSKNDDLLIPRVKGTLNAYSVYPLRTLEELEELYSNIPLSLMIIDTAAYSLTALDEFLHGLDDDTVLLITSGAENRGGTERLPKSVYGFLDVDSVREELPGLVRQALERQMLKSEIRLLKQSKHISPEQVRKKSDADRPLRESPGGRYLHEKVLVHFARMLTVNFDMHKLFNCFMDSVMEIARVGRMSVMLKDKGEFYVKTQYGLDPAVAEHLALKKDSALAARLSKQGRILHKPEKFDDQQSALIRDEMELLQCSVSFPIIYKGKLIGIFNIDDKITEEPFYREELEIIYVLCNYLAAAVKDVDLYHQIMYQKEFTKNIVSGMNSGMIVAGRDERINVFNPQASEILNIESSRAIGSHLSSLPSPLGDILLETLIDGTVYSRHEANVGPDKTPLGINSYRLFDETKNPVGAGIVFNDISHCRKLEEQSRRTAKLQAVNELMAKIAHEVRNPLTSIQTYTQLLNEKYADDELHEFYISAVTQSIDRLDNLIDKLVTFSTTQEYSLKKESLGEIFNEAVHYALKKLPATHKLSYQSDNGFCTINADRKNLIKAFYYLVESIVEMTPDGAFIKMQSSVSEGEFPVVEVAMKSVGGESVTEAKDELTDPFLDMNHLGSGLNVPLCQKIIEKHGGTLEIRNDNGLNAFVVTLPLLNISVPGEQKSGR